MIIKLFENFNKEDYYVFVDEQKWADFTVHSLSEDDIQMIRKHCKLNLDVTFMSGDSVWSHQSLTWSGRLYFMKYNKNKVNKDSQVIFQHNISIYNGGDEFFYIQYRLHDWDKGINDDFRVKCDQLEGVFEFFRDKGIYK